jgi:hypothetical protein
MGLAEGLGNKPWLPTYTKAEISSIFQNQFLEKTRKFARNM